jgi:hypothetical protein
MHRCRRREIVLPPDQHLIWYTLTGGCSDYPTRNMVVAKAHNCSAFEQLVWMGFMKLMCEEPGFRRYGVTEAGAAAVGLWLPESS